jgi:hypothetical protein
MAFQYELDEIWAEIGRVCNFPMNGAVVALRGKDTTPEPDPSAIHSVEPGGTSRKSKRGYDPAREG